METTSIERPKYKVSKGSVFGLLFLGGLIIFCLVSGIAELSASTRVISGGYRLTKGETVELEADCGTAFPILTVTNSIDFIPTLKEYYYIVGNDESYVIVRAGKNFGENFDPDTYESRGALKVSGRVRSLGSKERIKISEQLNGSLALYTDTYSFIDTYSRRIAVIKVIIAVGSIVLAAMIIKLLKGKKENEYDDISQKTLGRGFVTVIAIGAIALCVLGIYICMML